MTPQAKSDQRNFATLWVAIVALVFLLAGASQAAEPDRFLQDFGDRAIGVLGDGSLSEGERRDALENLLESGFHMDRIAKLALGRYWRTATQDRQMAYQTAFENYIVSTYDRRLSAYSGQRLVVDSWSPVKRDAMVKSRIVGDGSAISIDWRVTQTDDGWRVLDIVVEGVSMLVTQRNEFATIIEREGGVDALIRHLEGSVQTAQAS